MMFLPMGSRIAVIRTGTAMPGHWHFRLASSLVLHILWLIPHFLQALLAFAYLICFRNVSASMIVVSSASSVTVSSLASHSWPPCFRCESLSSAFIQHIGQPSFISSRASSTISFSSSDCLTCSVPAAIIPPPHLSHGAASLVT